MDRPRNETASRRVGRALAGVMLAGLIAAASGEIALRLYYWNGTSFGSHGGPLVKRFERDFKFNRFDGPSRGPEVLGPKEPDTTRIVLQGDSITWGQGIRHETDLYSTLLLQNLRGAGMAVEMAVLARPGREIDGHLEQLQKWGTELQPDVIVYQFYINDLELDHSTRPRHGDWFWRLRGVHWRLISRSYLYFLVDYSLDALLTPFVLDVSYPDYMTDHFSPSSKAWNDFLSVFDEWSTLAKSLTPRVLVVIYPDMIFEPGNPPRLDPKIEALQDRVKAHCRDQQLAVLDLFDALNAFRDAREIKATGFDAHPSVAAHRVIADAIQQSLEQDWPAVFIDQRTRRDRTLPAAAR